MRKEIKRPRILLLFVLLVLLAACVKEPEQKKELKSGETVITLTGTVLPNREAEIISPIPAVVKQILVKAGDKVKVRQPLLKLDPTAAKAEVARAEAALATAQANLMRAERNFLTTKFQQETGSEITKYEQVRIILENAKAELERAYSLFAREVVSRPELEGAQNNYAEALLRFEAAEISLREKGTSKDSPVKIAKAQHEAALAQLRQAQAALTRAKSDLKQTTLKAAFPGIVTDLQAQKGQKVYEGRPTLLKIVDISQIRVKVNLSPGLLTFIHVGQEAKVTIETIPPTETQAVIDQIQPVADPKTQALGVFFTLPNSDLKFQPGFLAQVEIIIKEKPQETKSVETNT